MVAKIGLANICEKNINPCKVYIYPYNFCLLRVKDLLPGRDFAEALK